MILKTYDKKSMNLFCRFTLLVSFTAETSNLETPFIIALEKVYFQKNKIWQLND